MRGEKRLLKLVALLMVLMMVAVACGGDGDEEGPAQDDEGEVVRGGILREEAPEFTFTSGLDPTGEYLSTSFAIFSQMMARNLVTYRHVAGDAGNELVPDLATDMPEVSEDGVTYTFTIKDGVMFGPPVSREIVCDDILYAFERIGTEAIVAQYGFYYDNTIEGLADFKAGDADTISGIQCNGEKEIEFTLTEETGDFLFRLAMPAAGPVPREVGECFEKAGEYGRFVISSGPYMIEGSEDLDISSCRTMEPISGWDPDRQLSLVRNPDYDPETDDPEVRSANIDGWTYTLNTNEEDIFNRVEAGQVDVAESPLSPVLRKYSTDPQLREHLHIEPGDRTWYITMNLAQPPFDDIHVRKAANLVMDKEGLQRAWGGPSQGEIATHVVPDVMLSGMLDDYDPYPSENHAGDLDAAKEEMRQSKYDSDGDGVCDSDVCENVLHLNRNSSPWTEMGPVIEDSLSKIGIALQTRELADAYPPLQDVSRQIAIGSNAGWGKDYPDAYTFVGFLFDGRNILLTGNTNYSLVGLTPERAAELEQEGDFQFPSDVDLGAIPSVDSDIDACRETEDDDERLQCWADLDKKLMEEVVPWVPYLDATNIGVSSEAVVKYEFDQFSGEASYVHISVDESLQQ
ncbi:MAG: ABC transporter substrate-binding protein [Actinomycetota bacterium]